MILVWYAVDFGFGILFRIQVLVRVLGFYVSEVTWGVLITSDLGFVFLGLVVLMCGYNTTGCFGEFCFVWVG